jgi:tellurite resistance protein
MHVVLGMLGTIVTILILLNRLADSGIDLGGLNPFLWHRRRKWRQRVEGNPVYTLEKPMEATALLMVAIAKCDGDMSAEQKRGILRLFEQEFQLSTREASSLLVSTAYLLRDGDEVRTKLGKVLDASREKFTKDQAESAVSLVERVSLSEGEPSDMQKEFLGAVRSELEHKIEKDSKWG